jgi:hypothetical protein
MNKLIALSLILAATLSSCTKNNYNCTCITNAGNWAPITNVYSIHDTKGNATTACNTRSYTYADGSVSTTCTLN